MPLSWSRRAVGVALLAGSAFAEVPKEAPRGFKDKDLSLGRPVRIALLGEGLDPACLRQLEARLFPEATLASPPAGDGGSLDPLAISGWLATLDPDIVHLHAEGATAPHWLALRRPGTRPEWVTSATDVTGWTRADAGDNLDDLGWAPRACDAIEDVLERHVAIARHPLLPPGRSGPEAAQKLVLEQQALDAQSTAAATFHGTPLEVPRSRREWTAARAELRQRVLHALGELPPRPARLTVTRLSRELRRGYTLESVAIDNGAGSLLKVLVLRPERPGPWPAALWFHPRTFDFNFAVIPEPGIQGGAEPLPEAMARSGVVVVAPQAYWYGASAGSGSFLEEHGANEAQENLAKLNLLQGRTLWGMSVREDQLALDYALTLPDVDRSRVGAIGFSAGCARAMWLTALDERVRAVAGAGCLIRFESMAAHGRLGSLPWIYQVNDARRFDTEGVLSLIAPRPLLGIANQLYPGEQADGVRIIQDRLERVWKLLGASERLKTFVVPEQGHLLTPDARAEMIAWLSRWLPAPEH